MCQSIIQWLVTGQYLNDEPLMTGIFSVFRKHSATLDKSVLRDFENIMHSNPVLNDLLVKGVVKQNKSDKTFTYDDENNKRVVEFCGADDEQKLRGPRRDYLYCNEANELGYHKEFFQLNVRTRRRVIVDFNPDDAESWLNTELELNRAVRGEKDVDIIVSTYHDNPFLSEQEKKEIENLKFVDEMLYTIYAKGDYGVPKGRVFKKVDYQPSGVPLDAILIGYGLDFGYTNDPTALVAIYKSKYKGKDPDTRDFLFFEEIIYKTGLTNSDIADILDAQGFDNRSQIWADCSEPKSIEELRRRGYNVQPVTKGKDSINYGIDIMKRYKLMVVDNSPSIMKEFRKYKYMENKDGTFINKPVDKYNHAIDGIRYCCMETLRHEIEDVHHEPVETPQEDMDIF